MRMHTKIAIAVRGDLAVWQKLNVTAFLSSGVAHSRPEAVGKPYEDASGNTYLAMIGQPVMVYAAEARTLARTLARARSRGLDAALYTADLFASDNDDDNRAAVREVPVEELDLVGVAVHGHRADVDKVTRGLRLHP